jgi:hypothetical protein
MPVYCARWPDASFSIVEADDEDDAYIQFDEFGCEPAEVWKLGSCALDFELTDAGTFQVAEFGGSMWEEILGKAYPSLDKAVESAITDHDHDHIFEGDGDLAQYDPAVRDLITKAVQEERERFAGLKERPASTELGKNIQQQVTGSGRYMDAMVKEVGKQVLKEHTPDPDKKPN